MDWRSLATSQWTMLIGGGIAAVTAVVALIWAKHKVRWLLGLATLGLAYLAVVFPRWERDPQFPDAFDEHVRLWLFVLGVVALYTTAHFVATVVGHYRGPRTGPGGEGGQFPDLDAAWQEILVQLSQARIDPTAQRMFLLLAERGAAGGA